MLDFFELPFILLYLAKSECLRLFFYLSMHIAWFLALFLFRDHFWCDRLCFWCNWFRLNKVEECPALHIYEFPVWKSYYPVEYRITYKEDGKCQIDADVSGTAVPVGFNQKGHFWSQTGRCLHNRWAALCGGSASHSTFNNSGNQR